MIYVIDDNETMARCVAWACEDFDEVRIFNNGIMAMMAMDEELPRLVFLDILLDGPDGFTLLNEMMSYTDTGKVPVVVVSSLDLAKWDLSAYGVVGVLHKDTMRPEEIKEYVRKYC